MTSRTYSITQARANLSTLVKEAQVGVDIRLTRRGKPVAVIVSCPSLRLRGRRSRFSDAYRRFLRRHPVVQIGVEGDFSESVRDKTFGRVSLSVADAGEIWPEGERLVKERDAKAQAATPRQWA